MILGMAVAAALTVAGAMAGGTDAPKPGSAPSVAPVGPDALRITVLPVENLSEAAAPLAEIRESLRNALEARRVPLLDEEVLEGFMRQHRMRYTAGLAREMGRALRAETGASAVLVTSLDLYVETDPPKIALTSRLISTGDDTRILWMDSVGRAGDEAPGFLGLGRIADPRTLREIVTDRIADSLARQLSGAGPRPPKAPARAPHRFRPKSYYRSPPVPPAGSRPMRIAVLPFSNESTTPRAGEILTLQVVRNLVDAGGVEVVEPGVVREVLLNARLIQAEGLSLPQAELLRALLEVDVVLFGEVTEYLEAAAGGAEPEIDFSVRAIDAVRRQVIWASTSHGRGDDGVFFFGRGRMPTAHHLACEMARALVGTILPSAGRAS